jgi:heme exporter protein C
MVMQRLLDKGLGAMTLVALGLTAWLGLVVAPDDVTQGTYTKFLYIHPALAWVALYLSFGTATIASGLYLWRRTRSLVADRIAAAAIEVSIVFIGLTLWTGSLWGRPVWGVWWAWDARLTSTAVLGVLAIGVLALRRANDDPHVRATRSAVLVILSAINVPIVHFSVQWWNTLHQQSIFTTSRSLTVHGVMAWTMLCSFVALSLCYAWMVRARYRLYAAADARHASRLDAALAARHEEGAQ